MLLRINAIPNNVLNMVKIAGFNIVDEKALSTMYDTKIELFSILLRSEVFSLEPICTEVPYLKTDITICITDNEKHKSYIGVDDFTQIIIV